MHAAIEISGISKTFGKNKALKEVNLLVRPGEVVALLGASGSGKSTLLRHVAGFIEADRDSDSEVRVNGQLVQKNGRMVRNVRQVRAGIGFVFQQFNLVGRLSLLTNVLLGALPRMPLWRSLTGFFCRQDIALGREALAHVGIDKYALQRASTLSGGQQQRAAIARTLVQKAEVVLADEPIASLDPAASRKVMDHLVALNREHGTTLLISLHQVDIALEYCPRVVAMRAGQVVYDGPAAALTPAFLKELYSGEIEAPAVPETLSIRPFPQPVAIPAAA